MNKFTILLVAAGAIVHTFASPLMAQSNWNPYGQSPYTSNPSAPPLPGNYQSNQNQDEDYSKQPNTQQEKTFTQESQKRYQEMNKQHQRMIDIDRQMMRKNYDPNQTFYYGESKESLPSSTSPVNPPYPKNQGSPYQSQMNQAETLIQGYQTTPNGGQGQGNVGRNPYLNSDEKTSNSEVKNNQVKLPQGSPS